MLKSTCAVLSIVVLAAMVFCCPSGPVVPSHPYLLSDGGQPPPPPIPIPWPGNVRVSRAQAPESEFLTASPWV